MSNSQLRYQTLVDYGANDSQIKELLDYNQNFFNHQDIPEKLNITPAPHIIVWQDYLNQAESKGLYNVLQNALVQFQFPIEAGISQNADYQAATKCGEISANSDKITGLILREPQQLELRIYNSLAGPIPVLIAANRQDFVTILQALTKRNEPVDIPETMGACLIAGYNNWDRIRRYKENWFKQNLHQLYFGDWKSEFSRIVPQKSLYQDELILLSRGYYSNTEPEKLGLNAQQWEEWSLKIRLEHECTHYFTRRLLGSMRNNMLDELIADYRGIVTTIGEYRSAWFLQFVGLEDYPNYRLGGRLENYPGNPPLSYEAFKILQDLIHSAANNLELLDKKYLSRNSWALEVGSLLALTKLTIEELASPLAEEILERTLLSTKAMIDVSS